MKLGQTNHAKTVGESCSEKPGEAGGILKNIENPTLWSFFKGKYDS